MNANATKWVAALRSGQFKQTKKQLRRGATDSFCCLGVACEVYRQETGRGEWEGLGYFTTGPERWSSFLPLRVAEWLGLRGAGGEMSDGSALYKLNDQGKRFKTIAKIIESEPDGLFA